MIIEWASPEFIRLRHNFNRHFHGKYKDVYDNDLQHGFAKELELHSGMIETITKTDNQLVVDSIGMNNYCQIRFTDENLYTLFMLKWS